MLIRFLFLLLIYTSAFGRTPPNSNGFFSSIKKYDLSKCWRSDSIQTEGDGEKIKFPEPLGFIGENYQRFYIHYLSVIKNSKNPYQYDIIGKTRVKQNICSFKGTIIITKAFLYKESDDPRYKQGEINGDILFYEDSVQSHSGTIKGKLITYFYLDKKGVPQYDALMAVADTYSNNQSECIWTDYKTGAKKVCNWGDYRIPESKELDEGTGDVYINRKFLKYGWQTFEDCGNIDTIIAKKAIAIEEREWWK